MTASSSSANDSGSLQGEVMDSVAVLNPEESGQRAALTDLTLALLQDSNWCAVDAHSPPHAAPHGAPL